MCDNHGHNHDHDHDHSHSGHHHHHVGGRAISKGLKIAITGKGGVGKTTLASMLARIFADDGCRVLAIDADPDANLAASLGIPAEKSRGLQPIARMKELAEERTGASGGYGSLFKLNPKVSDLPERFCLNHDGVNFLWMGTLESGGTGCACPENTLVKRLMGHLLLEHDDVVIMDMEAGIEHLGRGTSESVDAIVVVVEPGQRSIQTANQIMKLAADVGIKDVFVVGSKVRDDGDRLLIERSVSPTQLLGYLSFSEDIKRSDQENSAPAKVALHSLGEVRGIKDQIAARIAAGRA